MPASVMKLKNPLSFCVTIFFKTAVLTKKLPLKSTFSTETFFPSIILIDKSTVPSWEFDFDFHNTSEYGYQYSL